MNAQKAFNQIKIGFLSVLFFIIIILVPSCTENARVRAWGSDQEVKLKPGERLVNVTWKNTDLWILTQDTTTGVFYFREKSSLGLIEGQITFK